MTVIPVANGVYFSAKRGMSILGAASTAGLILQHPGVPRFDAPPVRQPDATEHLREPFRWRQRPWIYACAFATGRVMEGCDDPFHARGTEGRGLKSETLPLGRVRQHKLTVHPPAKASA